MMSLRGQVIRLQRTGRDGEPLWAYWYRVGGRDSKPNSRGGFASQRDAAAALGRELERLRREQRISRLVIFAAVAGLRPAEWAPTSCSKSPRNAKI